MDFLFFQINNVLTYFTMYFQSLYHNVMYQSFDVEINSKNDIHKFIIFFV